MKRSLSKRAELVLTCEHGGNRVPREYAQRFRNARSALESHRGWDPGALPLARRMSERLRVPLRFVTWSRLVVEANRSPENSRIWSSYTEGLTSAERERALALYYWPHRREVEAAVRSAAESERPVLHIAVHSFTPQLGREVRNADVGLLYDSRRPRERALAEEWQKLLGELAPSLRVRRNYPYLGKADGLATWLRKRFPDRQYAGFELEVNQAVFASPKRREIERVLVESVVRLISGSR